VYGSQNRAIIICQKNTAGDRKIFVLSISSKVGFGTAAFGACCADAVTSFGRTRSGLVVRAAEQLRSRSGGSDDAPVHVAFMLRGVAGVSWETLKIKGNARYHVASSPAPTESKKCP